MKKTNKKTQEVKIRVEDSPKKEVKENTTSSFTQEEKDALDGFFEKLKKSVLETAETIWLSTKENHSYYVSYCYVKNGETVFDATALETNLNIYERHGYGIRLLTERFKQEKNIDGDLTILNVVKLED